MATKTKIETNGRLHDEALSAALAAPVPKATKAAKTVQITAPTSEVIAVLIRGTAPYVQNRWGAKAIYAMKAKQEAGSTAKKGTKRDPKDFLALYEDAKHVSSEGWPGIPASAFRNAAISACRLVGFKMTLAKLSLSTEADGYDRVDFTPLVRITKGQAEYCEHPVRNDSGVMDIRPRPLFAPGWEAVVRLKYDADQFTTLDVLNLLRRVGEQVGLGEGRPDSPNSSGMGWGLFQVIEVVNPNDDKTD